MPDAPSRRDVFALDFPLQSRLARAAFAAARPALSRALGLEALANLYAASTLVSQPTFASRALQTLAVSVAARVDLDTIPAQGPLIVAANHPTGALDGLVVADLLHRVRRDVRVLANHLLARIPELRGSCFFVDPFGGPGAAARSQAGLRAAHLWVRRGGALIVFPSGEVAADREGPWHDTIGRLALATRAPVLPVFLDARNSRLFRAASRLHPGLRTLLLPRELLNKRHTTVRVFVGAPIDGSSAGTRDTPAMLTDRAREAVARLALSPATDSSRLCADIETLPPAATLLSSGPLTVYHATSAQIPNVLQEIGRLREITFRAVGEGTGQPIDLDRFDRHYDHLFVWNRARHEVVGAYRIGATDRILRTHGVDGLYTRTLFRYDEALLQRMGPALELGRSFVRVEYQRSYNALLLLWKGIGRVLAEAPRYRALFGPVSISSRYHDTSQQLLRAFLAQNHLDRRLHSLVRGVNPPAALPSPARGAAAIADVAELDTLIRRLEGREGIPVLLRQYMRLNATLLGFNVDPAFGDALDALMMVEIARIPASLRARYLGAAENRRAA